MADAEKDIAKDGLLAIAPRDTSGRPTLGGIPLYKKLGQGGMGAVYLGKHPRLGVEVAVKILPFHLADQDPNAIEYFMREANVAARLNHPSLVRIFDVNVDGDPKSGSAIWYLVMEFVSGQTAGRLLKDRMKAGQGPLPETDALDILLTVSDGLAAAHEQRFVHRDIKPENIIIPRGPDGALQYLKSKLMDLGLAKAHSEELSLGPTGTNVAMGTPGYMAPEQAENAKGAGPPADVFAMGATLYNLLTGAAPFTGTTILNVLKKTSDEPHAPLRQLNPSVTRATEILVDTCLAKRPEARYAGAGVLREALKACRQSLGGDVPTDVAFATLQSLASISSVDRTVRVDDPSLAPSAPARTAATAAIPPTISAPPRPGAAKRGLKGPLLVVALLLAAAGVGGFLLLRGDGKKSGDPAPPAVKNGAMEAALADAEAALGDEDYAKAESLFAKARQMDPKSEAAAGGLKRARDLMAVQSTAATAVGDAEAFVREKDYEKAWKRARSAIENYPQSIPLRVYAANLALDHGPFPWLGLALNDAETAIRLSGPRRKPAATQLRDKLLAKKREAEKAGGAVIEIQAAIDNGDWDGAEKLLDRVGSPERKSFEEAIEQGRRWRAAVDLGKAEEAAKRWPEALAAYQQALKVRSDSTTEASARRVERELQAQYSAECDAAAAGLKEGRFADAKRRLETAQKLLPSGRRHEKLREDVEFQEHLADARRLKGEGKNGDALAAAMKALAMRGDSSDAQTLVDQLKKEGPLAMAKASLSAGDRSAAAKHAREAAALKADAAELKALEAELWADLYVEKAVAPTRGPVDELMTSADGRIVGIGSGYGSFGVWAPDDLKPLVAAPAGSRPFHAALIDKDGLKLAGLSAPPEAGGRELQPVSIWEDGRPRALVTETRGLKIPVTATRLAPFDGTLVLRVRWTPGDDRTGTDSYSIDALDTEGAAASNAKTDRSQAHASIAVAPGGSSFATGGGIYRTWKKEGNRAVVDERKADTFVYLWSRDFTKRPVDLGEPVGEGALLAFTTDGARLLVSTAEKKLFVIDVAGASVDRAIPLPDVPLSLGASASTAAIVAGRRVHLVRLDDSRVAPATGFAPARSILASADGASWIAGGDDGLLRRYSFEPLAK